MNKISGIIVFVLFGFLLEVQAVEQREVEIYFDRGSCTIDSTYMDNTHSLATLSEQLLTLSADSTATILVVDICSNSSPDGDLRLNNQLSANRAEAISRYLRDLCLVSDSLVVVKSNGVAWDMLREMVSISETPHKAEVIDIIDNVPVETWRRVQASDRWQTLVDSRNKRLMDLRHGNPYRYMMDNIFPYLRQGSIVTIYFRKEMSTIIVEPIAEEPIIEEPIAEEEAPHPLTEDIQPQESPITPRKPLKFALKSNLLYDLLLTPNIELEIPIRDRFSVSGEWIFPWWTTKDNGYALQVLSGQLEGRYWFGDRSNRPLLTGWFASLYAGGGLYDLQWRNNGYQGEFYIASGLGGGYAHTINRKGNLRMEYSLGFGYLKTNYRYYEGVENNAFLVWHHNGNYTWVGPTKAKVSLVWFIDWQRGGTR